ncbi:type III-B CRISPR module RAMP protein Cmr6 [Porphyromonas gingivalis]|uniref:type III-B CRISPR module RAMP protein Cmr6 n=1 Tax=Porphyromonas gingivalis TaxID=837 RepID=UPI000717A0FE|nr:type III-B CRISPR module RAMP protein Cmr6 [Porphyromonas gingivalis]ALO30432.1 CRISPR-associated protein, Cmr6 family [Porphyromonas gingivalis A7A1-28]SJL30901.1 type III-B CRISPR module RAMP protein Cmr6 [Porphyromonas gingivalis]
MNFGYWYYREYFNTIKLNSEGIVTNFSTFNKGKNDKLIKGATLPPYDKKNDIKDVTGFELKTCYPGLLCGVGYHHEINKPADEKGKKVEGDKEDDSPEVYNLGMYFDYTSGLPVIPGSSIKGMLRSAIEEWDFLADYKPNNGVTREEIIKTVFEGKGLSIYDRDIFLDAIPIRVDNKLFGEDYITHHPNPLQNPNPVRFLRVNPGVTYQFRFILKDHGEKLTVDFKTKLFKAIICTFGLGAKTNVGYGQFVEPEK